MHIQCEQCGTEHQLDPPAWVTRSGRAFRFRCSSCGHSQMVDPPGVQAATVATSAPDPATPAAPAPESLPDDASASLDPTVAPPLHLAAARVTEALETAPPPSDGPPVPGADRPPFDSPADATASPVYLKQDGKVYMVQGWATLQQWIMERRVGPEDLVSEGGVRWSPIGSRAELESFFSAVDQLDEQREPLHAPVELPFDDDTPFGVDPSFPLDEPAFGGEIPFDHQVEIDDDPDLPPDDDTEGVPVGLPSFARANIAELDGPPTPEPTLSDPSALHGDHAPAGATHVALELVDEPDELWSAATSPAHDAPFTSAPQLVDDDDPPAVLEAERERETPPRLEMPFSGGGPAPGTTSEALTPDAPTQRNRAPDPDTAPEHADEEPSAVDADDPFAGFSEADPVFSDPGPVTQRRSALLPVAILLTLLAVVLVGSKLIADGAGSGPSAPPSTEASVGDVLARPTPAPAPPAPEPAAEPDSPPGSEPEAPEEPAVTSADDEPGAPTEPAPPPASPKPAAPSIGGLVQRGWSLADSGDLTGSANAFEQALAQNGSHADASYGYGYVLIKQGRNSQAAQHLCRARRNAKGDLEIERDVSGILERHALRCD